MLDQLCKLRLEFINVCKETAKKNPIFNGTINPYKDLMTKEEQTQFKLKISNVTKGEKNPRYKWTPEIITKILDYYNTHSFIETKRKFKLQLKHERCLIQIFKRSAKIHNTNYIIFKTIWNKTTNEEKKWQLGIPLPKDWTYYPPTLRKQLHVHMIKVNQRRRVDKDKRFKELLPVYTEFIKYKNKNIAYEHC